MNSKSGTIRQKPHTGGCSLVPSLMLRHHIGTLWGANLAVVWGCGSQHGRFERHDKIGKKPLKKKTLDLATNSQKMRKIEKGQKCCATRVCLHMVKQRWANQHAYLQHTSLGGMTINQNVRFWATLAQNTSMLQTGIWPHEWGPRAPGGQLACKPTGLLFGKKVGKREWCARAWGAKQCIGKNTPFSCYH